ncbi:MAG: outer membrane beta-barrel protein [Pseudolabrys sp.]|nr:outer membrane beta-barrel protein [Pseudolabrys sp.]MDP2294970.1 outer membrane beta-barrel protein [Pseudolabrys sp.]
MTAVCTLALGVGVASAQIVPPDYPDPLAPKLQTDPRKPPRFQQFSQPAQAQLGPPTNFTTQPSAAGNTGFDSTNSMKAKNAAKARSKPKQKSSTDALAAAPAIDPAPAVSPYQKPFPSSAPAANAAAPGSPPVEIGPIRKQPAKRKAHSEPDDPYTPLGVQAGSFLLFPAIEVIGGYDTNPSRAPSAKGASLYSIAPELRAQSNWSRHELTGELRGSYTGYSPDTEPTLSRPNVNGKVDGRVDVLRDTRIDLGGRLLVATDNPGSPNLQAGLAKLPIYTTFGGSVGLGQKFSRFDLSLKGDAERTAYQGSKLTDGTTASNADRNYNQYGVKLRGGYELTPGVMPFVEAGVDTRRHDLATDSSGYQRNSNGITAQVGSTFELSRLLTGEVAVGYTRRKYDDARLANLSGLIGSASLVWTANALTTVKFTAASAIGESAVPGVSGSFYRDAGVQIDHSFRRWLIGSVKLGFGLDDYVGMSREDKRFTAGAGLTYKLNRSTQIKGEFRQDWLRSNVSGNDYTASIFMLGLRFQQ